MEHGWIEIDFFYASRIECKCGFQPQSQEEMDMHADEHENEWVDQEG